MGIPRSLQFGSALLALVLSPSCGVVTGGSVDSEEKFSPPSCAAPDQRLSFQPRPSLHARPLRVTYDLTFLPEEIESLRRAIASWNAIAAFDGMVWFEGPYAKAKSVTGSEKTLQFLSCEFEGDAYDVHLTRVESQAQWSDLGLSERNPGVTLRCRTPSRLVRQTILVRPDLMPKVQVESILLHELGHTLGLDHSCAFHRNEPDWVGCSMLDPSHPYVMAVLYPLISKNEQYPDRSEIKETLEQNDRDRALCWVGSSQRRKE